MPPGHSSAFPAKPVTVNGGMESARSMLHIVVCGKAVHLALVVALVRRLSSYRAHKTLGSLGSPHTARLVELGTSVWKMYCQLRLEFYAKRRRQRSPATVEVSSQTL
uniref:Uncharacterized protein n=1 Tax=Anopheles maculatus TaxID=74869 RepID=A0A182SNU0_9DIPT